MHKPNVRIALVGSWVALMSVAAPVGTRAQGPVESPSRGSDSAALSPSAAPSAPPVGVSPAPSARGGPAEAPAEAKIVRLRAELESVLVRVGELLAKARSKGDSVRATCIADKQRSAADVMELATTEALVAADRSASPQARAFATEKLEAARVRLQLLWAQARECQGTVAVERDDDTTKNRLREASSIAAVDPTLGRVPSPLPSSVSETRPGVVASPTM